MNALAKSDRQLTEQQANFLTFLFAEAKGNVALAGKMAGYHTDSVSNLVKSLREEMIEGAKGVLAMNSPRAAMTMVGYLDDEAFDDSPLFKEKLAVAKEILDRVGIAKNDGTVAVNLSDSNAIFILPAKHAIPDG